MAVAVFPSVTVIGSELKTMSSMEAAIHGLVTTISNVTSGTMLLPEREVTDYPCPPATVIVVSIVTVWVLASEPV